MSAVQLSFGKRPQYHTGNIFGFRVCGPDLGISSEICYQSSIVGTAFVKANENHPIANSNYIWEQFDVGKLQVLTQVVQKLRHHKLRRVDATRNFIFSNRGD